jgi:hypothetical protein
MFHKKPQPTPEVPPQDIPTGVQPDVLQQDIPTGVPSGAEGGELGTPVDAQKLGKMTLWVPGEEKSAYFTRAGKKGDRGEGSGVIVTDNRRNRGFHLGIADEIYAEGQERLKTPLSTQESLEVLGHLIKTTTLSAETADKAARQTEKREDKLLADDLEGDRRAVDRLIRIVKGATMHDSFGKDEKNQYAGMSVAERLDDLVARYAKLATPEPFLNSMGGTEQIGGDGKVHFAGYNGSTLYEAVRARQIWGTMQQNPKDCRLKVLAMSEGQKPDSSWLVAGPAVVPEELRAAQVDTALSAVR